MPHHGRFDYDRKMQAIVIALAEGRIDLAADAGVEDLDLQSHGAGSPGEMIADAPRSCQTIGY
jgi:hypothetical protein